MSEALFRSAHQALLFAYTFSDTEHGTAAAAERQIALAARERYERTASSGRGLKGVDGAAQAGMIRSIVDCNTRPAFGVLCVARFALLDPVRRDAACNLLARMIGADMPPTVGLPTVARLLRGCTGRAVNIADLAEQSGVTRMTANRWSIIARRFVREIESPGMATIEPLLCAGNIVASAGMLDDVTKHG